MKIPIYAVFGLMVVALLGGMVIGYSLTSDYRFSMYEKNVMTLGPADRTFDLRYINAMIAHHRGAMLLAEKLAQNTQREELKALAADILKAEPGAIEELYAWKKEWYGDTKTVRDPIVANLGPKGERFDLRFLNAMIAHHEAGIAMADETQLKSSRAEILDNSYAVEDFLSGGIEALQGLRNTWYNI